jgi:hypothetical protein
MSKPCSPKFSNPQRASLTTILKLVFAEGFCVGGRPAATCFRLLKNILPRCRELLAQRHHRRPYASMGWHDPVRPRQDTNSTSIPELDHMHWVGPRCGNAITLPEITALSPPEAALSPGRPDAADAVAVDLGHRFSKPLGDVLWKARASNATHTQAHLSGTVIWPTRGLQALALTWHWRVPMPRARAVAAASQGARAQGQTNVYEQGTHQA